MAPVDSRSNKRQVIFADPYKKCRGCGGWVDGVDKSSGLGANIPCGHVISYDDVCPSWGPVDGCTCVPKGHGRTNIQPCKVR